MATKKKKPRKQTGMINLTTLRRLAKKVFGSDTRVLESRSYDDGWSISTTGERGVSVEHPNHTLARRALKAALEALVKG